jgi:hypothetical protein
MKRKLFAIILVLVLISSTAACGINIEGIISGDNAKTPDIVGKWSEIRDDDSENIFRFDDDNTGNVRTKVKGELLSEIEFIWQLDGDVLKIWLTDDDGDPNGSNFKFKFEITKDDDGEKLELYNSETNKSSVYKRQ